MADNIQLQINYYVHMGYGQHIQDLCLQHLQKRQKDPILLFWHAFGSILEGSYSIALQELKALLDHKEVEFVAIATMIHVHQLCSMVEIEEVRNLEQRLEVAEKYGSETALYLGATLYSHLGGKNNVKKSKVLIAKILQVQPQYAPAQCLNGWLNLILDKDRVKVVKKQGQGYNLEPKSMECSLRMFDEVLTKGNCLEAHLGRAHYYELRDEIPKALDELNQAIVSYESFIPALCEKARLGLLLHDWALAQETAQLILQKDPNNIEGLRLTIHVMLCTENDSSSVAHLLGDLLSCIEQKETRNANLYLQVASPLARIAGRGRFMILHKTMAFIERAQRLFPQQATFTIEMAEELFLLADYRAALLTYRLASQLDELNMEALYGAVQCLLVLGKIEEAEQQLEFLVEIYFSTEESASLCYLMAQLTWEKSKDYNHCRELLVKTMDYHTKDLVMMKKYDYKFSMNLNFDRLLGVAHLFLSMSRYECKGLQVDKSFCLHRGIEILELLLDAIPGLLMGHLMLAEALIQLEQFDSAQCTIQTALNLDATCATAQILLTQVYVHLGKHEMAKQSLEQALSDDFTVRDTIKYHVLDAQILLQANVDKEALKVLESAMCLPEMKHSTTNFDRAHYYNPTSKKIQGAIDEDRVLVYLLQADVHMRFGHIPEATKIIQDAMHRFAGTPEEVRVLIANCDLALGRGDVNAALTLLQQVPCESNYYAQAKVTTASVYLKHWHDKFCYINCYLDLVENFPNAKTYMMLGEAFMKVDELKKAIKAYEAALKESPKDINMISQIGKALVTTHNYTKAIEHYKYAMQIIEDNPMKFVLYYDLADGNVVLVVETMIDLYFKLKNYEQVEIVLNDLLARAGVNIKDKKLQNSTTLLLCLKGSLLLSKVQHLLGKHGTLTEVRSIPSQDYLPCSQVASLVDNKHQKHLVTNWHQIYEGRYFFTGKQPGKQRLKVMLSTKNIQNWLLPKFHGQQEDIMREHRNVAADIYFHFAKECEVQKDLDKTVTLLNEALNCNATHSLATLALAKIYLSRGDVSECEQRCVEILRFNPFNLEASDILVHLMLYKELYESAIIHFKQNLERDPRHYASLCQLIRLLQSVGQLDDARQYVLKAEKASPAFQISAGLYFCKGLIAHYSKDRFQAIQMLNHARVDVEWGKLAIYLLIEVYLNIDHELVWETTNFDDTSVGREEDIKAAWKLLGESRLLDSKAIKQLVLECYATMATRQRTDIEFALGRLDETLTKGEQSVSVLLAIAIAWTLLKQPAKARVHLRLIDRSIYRWEDGEDFEQAWLMLASILLQSGKHDGAEELCRKCLKYNKDCGRAWEYLGLIMETSHSSTTAVGYLENAWKCYRESSPSLGYRLAFVYLKEKRYIEAISISHKVLKICNNCPQIKKDILDKARVYIRC